MVSLVERLRRTEKRKAYLATCRTAPVIENEYDAPINPDGPEAADTIEAQAAEIERLREALERIVLCFETGDYYANVHDHIAKGRAILNRSPLPTDTGGVGD